MSCFEQRIVQVARIARNDSVIAMNERLAIEAGAMPTSLREDQSPCRVIFDPSVVADQYMNASLCHTTQPQRRCELWDRSPCDHLRNKEAAEIIESCNTFVVGIAQSTTSKASLNGTADATRMFTLFNVAPLPRSA